MARPREEPPQAEHWLLRRGDRHRRRIGPRTIVSQAHDILHSGGVAALSMRSLAADLNTSTSALYRHVPSKEWLLISIVDLVLEDVDTTTARSKRRSPRRRLESLSASLRDVLAEHPHLHEILASHVVVTPSTIRLAEAALECLRGRGIPDEHLIDAYNAWAGYVIGFTTIEVKPRDLAPERALQRAMRSQLAAVDPADFPLVSELLPLASHRAFGLSWIPDRFGGSRSSFDWGLEALLNGFDGKVRPGSGE